jgi:hemerythrin-like domain-containing protein
MKREKYFWPLSQSHHRALVAAKRVKEWLSSTPTGEEAVRLNQASAELKKLYEEELRQHFWDEERILIVFEGRMGEGDPDDERMRKEHRLLESLLAQNTQENLLLFAETLVAHIRFEEDVLFGRMEGVFNEADQKAVLEILPHLPSA